jgi:hypothetical protein
MIRLAAILALCATPAVGQNFPSEIQTRNDSMSIEAHGVSEALVRYHNHVAGLSNSGTYPLAVEVDGAQIVVDIVVTVNAQGSRNELIQVLPRGGFMALPPEALLPDGEEGEFRVMLPMY